MNVFKSIDKSKKYLLACSFGPDSMALFKMLLDEGINFEVAHVNYHKRAESNGEEFSLKEYCKKHNIVFNVLDASKYSCEGNFQAWARDLRYKFFKDCCLAHNLEGVFVAHQQDDLIENYFIQKQRKALVKNYGISEFSKYDGITIIRPLLNYSKKELQDFDDLNNIPYSIDVSNLTDHYTRNKIRHSVVEKMDKSQRSEIVREINLLNKEQENKICKALNAIDEDSIDVKKALNLDDETFSFALFELLKRAGLICPLSNKEINVFKEMLYSNKANIEVKLSDDFSYVQEYGTIKIVRKLNPYKLTLDEPGKISNDFIELDFSLGAEDRNIKIDSYPISIEPASKDDKYRINNYEVSVSRLFLDWKMPYHLRSVWPVIKDCNGKIIYIPRYRKDFVDNHKSLMKIKLK